MLGLHRKEKMTVEIRAMAGRMKRKGDASGSKKDRANDIFIT